ncbi:YihY/virulence factor BrkB family protein [Colwellia piezophila]|uniref:YihY/virulence factor BrkB family protein n=1 Tax=Colwellia piezophila TaxID=211668 RepID=UPI0003694D5E|nr:YihY/virulence factor BrkB family protein [Colwellia piezophila]
MKMLTSIVTRLNRLHDWAIERPYLGVLVRATDSGLEHQSKDSAAAIAYYTLLSLFPLILGLISIGGYFLTSSEIQLWMNDLIVKLLPVSAEFVTQNIDSLVRIRGAAGITSVVVLMWSASKVIGALSRAINCSLGMKRNFAVYLSPFRYFGLTLIIALLALVTLAISPTAELLSELKLDVLGSKWNMALDIITNRGVGYMTTGILVSALYILLPYRRLPWRDLLPGLLVAIALIETGKMLFIWYVETAANYSAVYGSLSSIIVLLIWVYFSARVVLLGAEIIGVIRTDK